MYVIVRLEHRAKSIPHSQPQNIKCETILTRKLTALLIIDEQNNGRETNM